MKRFTATEKWDKPWFRRLPPRIKCFLQFCFDKCDCAGVWEPDFEAASFAIGEQVTEKEALEVLAQKIHIMPNGKWWIRAFIPFQYGELSLRCKPHQAIFATLKRHSLLTLYEGYAKGMQTLQEKEKEKEQEKEKERKGSGENTAEDANCYEPRTPGAPSGEQLTKAMGLARIVIAKLNELTGSRYREAGETMEPIALRLVETAYDLEGVLMMIERQSKLWKGDPRTSQGLNPKTLFGERFENYYGARGQEIPAPHNGNGNGRTGHVIPDHSKGF